VGLDVGITVVAWLPSAYRPGRVLAFTALDWQRFIDQLKADARSD
jgi:hypothetical protein